MISPFIDGLRARGFTVEIKEGYITVEPHIGLTYAELFFLVTQGASLRKYLLEEEKRSKDSNSAST